MPADQNFSFHHSGGFPRSFLNPHVVSFQSGAVNSAVELSSAQANTLGDVSNITGMVMAGNTTNVSSIKTPCNSSGSTLPDPMKSPNHCIGLSTDWSDEELDVLRSGLVRYVNESGIMKYIKIANLLPDKTVRDVAMRCRWMTKKEHGKRRKANYYNTLKKVKDEKEMMVASSSTVQCIQPENTAARSHLMASTVDIAVQQLLVENFKLLNQIERNLAVNEIEGNIHLFSRTRDNITAILNNISQMPGTLSQMPSLPVSVDQCLLHYMSADTNPNSTLGFY